MIRATEGLGETCVGAAVFERVSAAGVEPRCDAIEHFAIDHPVRRRTEASANAAAHLAHRAAANGGGSGLMAAVFGIKADPVLAEGNHFVREDFSIRADGHAFDVVASGGFEAMFEGQPFRFG